MHVVSGNPLFFTSHSVTRQGKRSERIHSFLAKVYRFLYAHVDFLALRTFKQAANLEVALCPNYLINYLSYYSSLHQQRHHYIFITSSKFEFMIGTRSVMKDFHYFPRPFIAFSSHSIAFSPFKWPAHTLNCACAFAPSNTRYQTGNPLFSSSHCRNSTKNVKYENPCISGDKTSLLERRYKFLCPKNL